MNHLDWLVSLFMRKGKAKPNEFLSSWVLVLLGIPFFLVSAYLGYVLSEILPLFLKAIRQNGLSWEAIGLVLQFGFIGAVLWYTGCIAARCHGLLYERWFK